MALRKDQDVTKAIEDDMESRNLQRDAPKPKTGSMTLYPIRMHKADHDRLVYAFAARGLCFSSGMRELGLKALQEG